MEPVHLSPEARIAALERLESQTFDVVVVGGGVVGTGCALDAATRGLSVALLEARDWAAGTSSRSSKLIHGGLRYLEQLEFGLVREALRERHLMLTRLCPHLVQPVSFLYPAAPPGLGTRVRRLGRAALRHAAAARHPQHAARAGASPPPPPLTSQGAGARAGAAQGQPGRGACSTTTRRSTTPATRMTIARTAAAYGAAAATGVQVIGFLREGERVSGVHVCDRESGREFDVRARVVVNATGVWTDATQELAGGRGRFQVRASKGIHLVVPRDRLQLDTGLIIRTEHSVLFVIPWGRHWIIGTTDTDWKLSKAHPAASSSDIDYVLDHLNAVLVTPLSREDVEGVYAGPAAAAGRRIRADLQALPRAPGGDAGAGPGRRRRRQVHDLPGDGARRDRPGRGCVGAARARNASPRRSRCSGAEGYPALWNRRKALADEFRAAPGARSSTCCTATAP